MVKDQDYLKKKASFCIDFAKKKGATLIGDGPSILKEVSLVGNNMMLDPGIGTCGKAGQGVPVGVAQPSILIDKMTVGGTQL